MNQRTGLASGYEGAKERVGSWAGYVSRLKTQVTTEKVWGKCGACVECGEERSGEVRGELGTPFLRTIVFFGVREVVVDGGHWAVVRLLISSVMFGSCRVS